VSDSKYNEATNKITVLQNQLNDLKNGARILIIEIRKQYESKNYDKVLELSGSLHSKFPGVPEDVEAQKLVKGIQDIKDQEAKKTEEEKAKLVAEQGKTAQEKAQSILRVSKIHPSNRRGRILYFVDK
jgi:hypothetical protein